MANHVKVTLTKFEIATDKAPNKFEYSIAHNNGETTVEQTLEIFGGNGFFENKWAARLPLLDFPNQRTPQEAADKMADWLERLAVAIRFGQFQNLPDSDYKELP